MSGIEAAKAAGMITVGFCGGGHCPPDAADGATKKAMDASHQLAV